jgi:Sulfatase
MRRFLEPLPAALLLACHFLVAASLENLYGNRMEFEFGSLAILPSLVGVALGVMVLLCLLGGVLPAGLRSRYIAVVFALGCLGWFQSSFLPGDYGQLTGETIDWSGHAVRGWLEVILWLGVVAAAVKFHKALPSNIRFIAPLLVVLELAGVGGRQLVSPAEAPPTGEGTLAVSLSRFSHNRNVLHVLMDGFQTGAFLDLVDEDGLAEEFDGFTVFRENAAVAPYTAMSLPAIFSGEIYDGTETPAQYHHRALRQGGFHHQLKDEGFAVHLITKIPMQGDGYTLYADTPHLYGLSRNSRLRHQVVFLFDLNIFRSSPHFLRPLVYNQGNWRFRAFSGESVLGLNTHQRAFFADYINQMKVVLDEPVYNFIHLMPPHGPFVTLPDGSDAGHVLPETRDNYLTEGRYTLRLFLQLLDRMREFGIYDSALIVLHADHGYGNLTLNPEHPRTMKVPRAPALLAVKRIGGHGPLVVSDAPTSLADIPATILGELQIQHNHPGESVFDLTAGQPRIRHFNSYNLGPRNSGNFRRYLLDGSLYDPEAWRILPTQTLDLGQPLYDWGERIEFGVGSDSDRYLGPEWSSGGAGGCRMNLNNTGTISLQTQPTADKVRAAFEFRPRLREGEQRRFGVRLYCNGQSIGVQGFKEPVPQEFEFTIPAGQAAEGALDLKFEFLEFGPDAQSTALTLCLMSMQLEPMPQD